MDTKNRNFPSLILLFIILESSQILANDCSAALQFKIIVYTMSTTLMHISSVLFALNKIHHSNCSDNWLHHFHSINFGFFFFSSFISSDLSNLQKNCSILSIFHWVAKIWQQQTKWSAKLMKKRIWILDYCVCVCSVSVCVCSGLFDCEWISNNMQSFIHFFLTFFRFIPHSFSHKNHLVIVYHDKILLYKSTGWRLLLYCGVWSFVHFWDG